MRTFAAVLTLLLLTALSPHPRAAVTPQDTAVPRFAHIFVIMDENKDYETIMSGNDAPNMVRLARTYGVATNFYAEVHPSEGNYVALVGGDNYGIRDDDAYYCRPGSKDPHCEKAAMPWYVPHTIDAPNIGTQLQDAGFSWKGYYQSLPQPGSLAIFAGDPRMGPQAALWQLYAFKHSGFLNFAGVQQAAVRKRHIVNFDALRADLASGSVPALAFIVPNQCNDMHGLDPTDYTGAAARVPADCNHHNIPGLVRSGDAEIGRLVAQIQHSAVWNARQNAAIVITFDEGSDVGPAGGHIPTIVITNHGRRGVADGTLYNHYALLRTIEDAFGIHHYLRHANDSGVRPMVPLFTP